VSETRCCDDIAVHCHDGLTYKDGRRYEWRCKFAWRWPKVVVCHAANRPPLVMLNRYPGIVIGIAIRLRGTRYLSVLWGRPNGIYEVAADG
jgi:hypothetical protein